jgi:hypothetical protein
LETTCNIRYKHLQRGLGVSFFFNRALSFTIMLTEYLIKISKIDKVQRQNITSPSHVPSSQPHTSIKQMLRTGTHPKIYSIKISTTKKNPEKHIMSLNALHIHKCKLSHRTDIQDTYSLCFSACTGLSIISSGSVPVPLLFFQ